MLGIHNIFKYLPISEKYEDVFAGLCASENMKAAPETSDMSLWEKVCR